MLRLSTVKQCPYCGTEYSDSATLCPVDRQPLNAVGILESQVATSRDITRRDSSSRAWTDTFVVYPEYRWSARDAWKFWGMILLFDILSGGVAIILSAVFHNFHQWRESPVGFFVWNSVFAVVCLFTAAYFARTETFESFRLAVGLNVKPSRYVWFGVATALVIKFFTHIALILTHAKGYRDFGFFTPVAGNERYFYFLPPLLAPFLEEPAFRGFLYRAFRSSYSPQISIAFVVGYTAYSHWGQVSHSVIIALSLSSLTVLQCYIREKSDSLWDCIWCHFAFNASGLLLSGALH